MNPIDFSCSVEELDLSIEANRRNSTSRNYYCLFHSIKEMFHATPDYRKTGTHEALFQFLKNGDASLYYDKKKLTSIAYILSAVKKLRVEADYNLSDTHDTAENISAVQTVKSCLQKIQELTAAQTQSESN